MHSWLVCEMKICKLGTLETLMHLEAIIGVEGQMWIYRVINTHNMID